MRRALAVLFLLATASCAFAQGGVLQSGTVTSGHAAKFVANGVIGDAGPATGGAAGSGLSQLGITNATAQALCINTGPVTAAYQQLCLGVSSSGASISLNALGGATPVGFSVSVNGQTYSFPQGYSLPLNLSGNYSSLGHSIITTSFTVDKALTDSSVNPTLNVANVVAAMAGHELWVNFDSVVYNVPGGDVSAGGNLVGHYVGMQRQSAAPNVPMDGLIIGLSDTTGLATSVSGGMYGLEIDLQANGDDDGSSQLRRGMWLALGKQVNGSAAPQASIGLGIISGSGTPFSRTDGLGFFVPISIQTPFRDAGIDFRSAPNMAGGTGNAVWLRTGQTIAFDTTGVASASVVKLSSVNNSLIGAHILESATAIQIGTAEAANINVDNLSSPNLFVLGLPTRLPGYTVGALPSIPNGNYGTIAFASNCRNSGETAGNGTGCVVVRNINNGWVAVWSGVGPTT